MLTSFSGCHPYRPQCAKTNATETLLDGGDDHTDAADHAVEIAAAITAKIDVGTCPRCDGPLPDGHEPDCPAGDQILLPAMSAWKDGR